MKRRVIISRSWFFCLPTPVERKLRLIIFNIIFSSLIIGLCTWLAEKRPDLGGFIVSLPLSTLIVLTLTQLNHGNSEKTILLAKSIALALPASFVFFLPFLLASYLNLNFWILYSLGVSMLVVSYFLHKHFFNVLLS